MAGPAVGVGAAGVGAAGLTTLSSVTRRSGKSDSRQPPPSALMRFTLAVIRLVSRSMAVRSLASEALCAVTTSRKDVMPPW